jgi:hypothetical protein
MPTPWILGVVYGCHMKTAIVSLLSLAAYNIKMAAAAANGNAAQAPPLPPGAVPGNPPVIHAGRNLQHSQSSVAARTHRIWYVCVLCSHATDRASAAAAAAAAAAADVHGEPGDACADAVLPRAAAAALADLHAQPAHALPPVRAPSEHWPRCPRAPVPERRSPWHWRARRHARVGRVLAERRWGGRTARHLEGVAGPRLGRYRVVDARGMCVPPVGTGCTGSRKPLRLQGVPAALSRLSRRNGNVCTGRQEEVLVRGVLSSSTCEDCLPP